jgi:hypothetical protein
VNVVGQTGELAGSGTLSAELRRGRLSPQLDGDPAQTAPADAFWERISHGNLQSHF